MNKQMNIIKDKNIILYNISFLDNKSKPNLSSTLYKPIMIDRNP